MSQTEFKDPLNQKIGLVSELSSFARPHYVAYRNYMGISPNAPIYLFDIRGLWWFDPQAIAAMIMSALLFMGILGSATRDPDNDSRLLFIPPELRGHLDSDEVSEAKSDHDLATQNSVEQVESTDRLTEKVNSDSAEKLAQETVVIKSEVDSSKVPAV